MLKPADTAPFLTLACECPVDVRRMSAISNKV